MYYVRTIELRCVNERNEPVLCAWVYEEDAPRLRAVLISTTRREFIATLASFHGIQMPGKFAENWSDVLNMSSLIKKTVPDYLPEDQADQRETTVILNETVVDRVFIRALAHDRRYVIEVIEGEITIPRHEAIHTVVEYRLCRGDYDEHPGTNPLM